MMLFKKLTIPIIVFLALFLGVGINNSIKKLDNYNIKWNNDLGRFENIDLSYMQDIELINDIGKNLVNEKTADNVLSLFGVLESVVSKVESFINQLFNFFGGIVEAISTIITRISDNKIWNWKNIIGVITVPVFRRW